MLAALAQYSISVCGATALVPVGDGVGLHGCLHLIWGGGDGGAHLVGYIHGAL